MTNIIIQISKYIIILLMAAYTFSCFSIFTRNYEDEEKRVLIRQDVLLFLLQMVSFFAIRMPEPSHRFSHRPFLTYDSAKSLRQTAVNSIPVLPHCTKFCRRKSRRVEQENAGWNSRKSCAIIRPQAKTACNMMKKKEGLFP